MSDDPSVSALVTGLQCRCPRCGQGQLYTGMFNLDLRPDCASCGLSYRFIDTGDGPAVFVIMGLGLIMLGAALWVEFTLHPPIWLHGLLWVPTTCALAFGMLRPLKALLIALQFRHKARQGLLRDDGKR